MHPPFIFLILYRDTIVVQEAIGDKLASFVQYVATVLGGFIIGFIRGWKLALVMLAVAPLIAVAGTIVMRTMVKMAEKGQNAYAKAGAYATEVISSIRTVASFTSEPIVATKYLTSKFSSH